MTKISIGLILLIALLAAACSRYIESDDLDFELPGEPPVPISVRVILSSDVVNLSWQVSDTIANMSFKVYYSDSLDGDYSFWETTDQFSSTIRFLKSGQLYFFKVSSVMPDGLEGKKSTAVSTRVGVISAVINDGEEYTNSRNVAIRFVVPAPTSLMQVSEDATFASAHWETFTLSKSLELSPGDGIKHIYARFRFVDGSESDSTAAVSDSIILDTEAAIDSVYFVPGDITFAKDSTITFYIITGESGGEAEISFYQVSGLKLSYDEVASDAGAGKHVYSTNYVIPSQLEVIDGVVTGRFTDRAGNVAPEASASSLLNISNPPSAVTIVAVSESSSSIRLNWSRAVDDDFTAYHIFRGSDSTVSSDSEPVTVINSRSTLTFKDSGLDESTEYFYRIYVYDNTGLSAESNVASAVTLVNLPPTAVTAAVRYEDSVFLSWTANSDDDFESYRLYRTTDTTISIEQMTPLSIINGQIQTSFTDNPASGVYFYGVAVFDKQGKWALSNWVEITVPL